MRGPEVLIAFAALLGVVAGLVLAAVGLRDAANVVWGLVTGALLLPLTWSVIRTLIRRDLGVDAIALVAMAGALALQEFLAGAVVALMLAGGNALEAAAGRRARHDLEALVARAPTWAMRRTASGGIERIPAAEVAPGDILLVRSGEIVPVDGRVEDVPALLDESALTGEAMPVERLPGDAVRSGVANAAEAFQLVATRRADESAYAAIVRLVAAAGSQRAPFERMADRYAALLLPVTLVAAGIAWAVSGDPVRALAVLVVATPCPLILAAPIALVSGVSRAARKGVVLKGGVVVEQLARTTAVLLDKTGTLTTGHARLVAREPSPGVRPEDLDRALGRFAAAWGDLDETLSAIALAIPAINETPDEVTHFSSRRRWSAVRFGDSTLVLGAPGVINAGPLADEVARESEGGRRVLVLARGHMPLGTPGPDDAPPVDIIPMGMIALSETLQPDVREAISFLDREGIPVHVISGDAPTTVGAIARDCGVRATAPTLASDLPTEPAALARAVARAGVIGRAGPDDKERIVRALTAQGATVAMFGDGVNDVPALKAAHVAIAPGTATEMARAVADVVLVRGGFSTLAPMVAEGRQVLRNLQRVSNLFVTKSFLAAFLILTIGLTPASYPFLPRHLSLLSALTIGIPALFLALAPSTGEWRPRARQRSTMSASSLSPAG